MGLSLPLASLSEIGVNLFFLTIIFSVEVFGPWSLKLRFFGRLVLIDMSGSGVSAWNCYVSSERLVFRLNFSAIFIFEEPNELADCS